MFLCSFGLFDRVSHGEERQLRTSVVELLLAGKARHLLQQVLAQRASDAAVREEGRAALITVSRLGRL